MNDVEVQDFEGVAKSMILASICYKPTTLLWGCSQRWQNKSDLSG